MINIIKADIVDLYKKGKVVCITTNGVINDKGLSVMGKGNAGALAEIIPNITIKHAQFLNLYGHVVGFIYVNVISFPTKPVYGNPEDALPFLKKTGNNSNIEKIPGYWCKSNIPLIEKSIYQLNLLVELYNLGEVYLPLPGVGNGQLKLSEIEKQLESLSTKVHLIQNG